MFAIVNITNIDTINISYEYFAINSLFSQA